MTQKKNKANKKPGVRAESTSELNRSTAAQSDGDMCKLPENNNTFVDGPVRSLNADSISTVSEPKEAKRKLLDEDTSLRTDSVKRLKTGRRDDKAGEEAISFPHEEAKSNEGVVLGHPFATANGATTSVSGPEAPLKVQWQALPEEIQHLRQDYQFSTMSILSSSKIESRVRNLLEKPVKSGSRKAGARPEVVILSAKAKIAGKLASIIEIAKAVVKGENGKWWQYTKLHGELLDLKSKQGKRTGGDRALTAWSMAHDVNNIVETEDDDEMEVSPEGKNPINEITNESDGDTEEEFEIMKDPKARGPRAKTVGEKEIRNTPVMTVFFSRVAVPELKELYG